jgi:hypothetical protein
VGQVQEERLLPVPLNEADASSVYTLVVYRWSTLYSATSLPRRYTTPCMSLL